MIKWLMLKGIIIKTSKISKQVTGGWFEMDIFFCIILGNEQNFNYSDSLTLLIKKMC